MIPEFATAKPYSSFMGNVQNLVAGRWVSAFEMGHVVDPMNKTNIAFDVPATAPHQFGPFIESLRAVPKSGLHNPLRNLERLRMLGDVCGSVAEALGDDETFGFFVRLIQRVMPVSKAQAVGEMQVVRDFFASFAGNNVRYLFDGTSTPGNHFGQEARGYRWPYGPVMIIAPFNFPIEIPILQTMGALFMGNKPLVKADSRVAIVMEQFIRLLHHCGLPMGNIDFMCATGETTAEFLKKAKDVIRLVQFTGSSRAADSVTEAMGGRVKIEDAGFDWKILGPHTFHSRNAQALVRYVAWQCDQDAYARSGQKCSAESVLFVHKDWVRQGLLPQLTFLAERRRLEDLTIGPVLTWNNEQIQAHIRQVLAIPGARLMCGGKPFKDHNIPEQYGAFEPTAVQVPFGHFLANFELLTTELFGPFQIVVVYGEEDVSMLKVILERMDHHLTAAVVSDNPTFVSDILSWTVNGTTYAGLRARTTGAPEWHHFGPAGDPRGASIGTRQGIISTWSTHREVITDHADVPGDWNYPRPS